MTDKTMNKLKKIKENSKGQIVLGVLLVLAVITTLGLSLSKKTEVETKIDTDEALLKQAFNTAESGVDYYLSRGSTESSVTYTESGSGGKAEVSVTNLGLSNTLDSDGLITENESMMFWLVSHDTDGNIDYTNFYNGSTFQVCIDSGKSGAVKVDYFYKDGSGNYKVDRYGYNFNFSGGVGGVDSFSYLSSNCSGDISVGSGVTPLLVAITPIINNNKITLNGDDTFPKQGIEISSVGRAGDLTSGVNTKVKVQNRYKVPAFMLEAITAGGGVGSE